MTIAPQKTVMQPVEPDSLKALQVAVAGYDRGQLLWSSGYLAGMAAARLDEQLPGALRPANVAETATWSIFYATETGNSRRLAETLAKRSRLAGLVVELHDLRDYRPKTLVKVEHALFILATHGNGEPPDGSEMFFEHWISEKAPRLENLNYSILALGDSSYADFCEMGRIFDDRLQELGATAIAERVDCDLDFDAAASAWTDQVVSFASELPDDNAPVLTPYLRPVSTVPSHTRERPFNAEILTTQRLTGRGSSKDVRHVEISLKGSGFSYQPGDSLAVIPKNPPELVEGFLNLLRLKGAQEVSVGDNVIALADALTQHKEITVLNRPFLNQVASEYENLQKIIEDRDRLSEFLKTRQIIDVVADYPKSWGAQEFVDSLRKLAPRLYSIASSEDANPDEAHLTVGVVRYNEYGRDHWGSASNYLISGIDVAQVYIEPNDHFRLPADTEAPIIMIGAGTGVAPYRAFIEHRREHGHKGDNWLIFGDRNYSTDFLYQLEWLRFRKEGLLSHIDVAFSRDQQDKVYVQHRIIEQAKNIYSWIERGAHIYVCGDADRMAGDVNEALCSVLQTEGGLSDEQAVTYLSELKSVRRYQRDVY